MVSKSSQKLTAIDLFAGAGGMSTGLEMAGFSVVFANEIMKAYSDSLKLNHPQTDVLVGDIRSVKPSAVRKTLGMNRGDLTLLAGGPPCQGFSVNAPVRSTDDTRNHLFLEYLRFVEEFQPKVVLIENVPGMVSFENGDTVTSILSSLKKLGYKADVRVLYCAHYGVPQMRYRTIFLATKLPNLDPAWLYPLPTHKCSGRANFTTSYMGRSLLIDGDFINRIARLKHTSVADAIGDLPAIPNGGGEDAATKLTPARTAYQRTLRSSRGEVTNHICAGLGKANLVRLPHIPPGGSWRDIPHDLLPEGMKRARRSDHTKRYGRLLPEGIASTILTKCDPHWGSYIHYAQDRVLSVREAARLQSFPDRIVFSGSISEKYEQVGNAVPPLFSKAIGERIRSLLSQECTPEISVPTQGEQLSLLGVGA